MNGVLLVDSTGQAKIDGTGTQLIIEQHAVFHIISSGSSLSASGSDWNQLLLAHALAPGADLRLFSTLEEDKDFKVLFIKSLRAWRQSNRKNMTS